MPDKSNLYRLDGSIPLLQALLFGLQHVMAMFVSNITPIIILANEVGVEAGLSASLVQNCMVIAGIGTLIQLYPVWRIGARLPMVKGISFTFLTVAIFIGATQGMGALAGAVIVGGIAEGLLGLFVRYWIRIISPVVAATVVTSIGFSLLPIGARLFAGGQGSPDFGSFENWVAGSVTLLVCVGFQAFGRGLLRSFSALIGLVVGYAVAVCLGLADFSAFHHAGIVSMPKLLPFKPEFDPGAILSVLVIYVVSAAETVGNTSALCSSALHRPATDRELGASISCDGFVSSISGLLGCTPVTSYSQNVGLAALSGVVNRFAIATGAIIMILAGIFPFFSAMLTSIPQAVLGGCTIMMFGTIVYAGFRMLSQCGFSNRNMVIVALSLSVGIGFTQSPEMFSHFPPIIRTVFGENCVASVFLLALVLNLVLPKEEGANQQAA
jgi:NCS2 family nucleobase:cation symporter-2